VLAEVVIERPAIWIFLEGVAASEEVEIEAVTTSAVSVMIEIVLVLSSDFIDSP
jgi:hypothetical protein